jgi:Domain of unknown function (DUF5664)
MNTEKKEHVVTEVYYPLGRKVPYLRSTGKPLRINDSEFYAWLTHCTSQQFEDFKNTLLDDIYAGVPLSEIMPKKTEPTYRPLEPDEVIQEGDGYLNSSKEWRLFELSIGNTYKDSAIYHPSRETRTTRPKPEQHAPAFEPKQDNQYVQTPEPVYRPLEVGEIVQEGDEYKRGSEWVKFKHSIGCSNIETNPDDTRTTRPNPTKPTPNFDPKGDEGKKKPQLQLIPPVFNTELAKALSFGAVKYEPWNWRKNKVEYMTYIGAMKRHIDALLEREDVASDSGVHHLGHIAASCAIVLDAAKHGTLVDNRPPAKLNSEPVVDNGAFKGVE